MSNRLRVGNIGFTIELSALKSIFMEFGTVVSAKIMESPLSGKSRGFGFIEMESSSEADTCIQMLNGKEHEGQKLMVTQAPLEKKSARRYR